MTVQAAVRQFARELKAEWHEGDKPALELTLGQRRTDVDLRVLVYRIGLEYNDVQKIVFFEESLWEQTKGPRGGVDLTFALRPKEETFRIIPSSERGTIEEQAQTFANRYEALAFDFAGLRRKLATIAAEHGYKLKHLIPL